MRASSRTDAVEYVETAPAGGRSPDCRKGADGLLETAHH